MSDYLAVDFGTSNCLAATITSELKLQLIPLEGDSPLLPSAIFIRRKDFSPIVIDPLELERRVIQFKEDEKERLSKYETSIGERLLLFHHANQPRVGRKPEPGAYLSKQSYLAALSVWKKDRETHPIAIKRFEATQLKEEEKRLRKNPPKSLSESEIRKSVLNAIQREQLEKQVEDYWTETFFSALNNSSTTPLFGAEAIQSYSSEPMSGYFMQSPKAFLAIKLLRDHQAVFTRIITLVLLHIKERAEKFTGKKFDGVVLGRPVNYMGSAVGGSNEQALEIMRDAARKAGFIEVRFLMEPLAAGLAISRTMFDTNHPALVVDIGGGTTDCAYLEVEPDAETKLCVIGVSGERIGGNDFDQSIALTAIAPLIGGKAIYNDGKPVPLDIIHSALNTRDIYAQGKFRKSADAIEEMMADVVDIQPIERLYEVFRCQLQHRLLLSSEQMKIILGEASDAEQYLDYFSDPVKVKISHEEFLKCADSEIRKIKSIVSAAINLSGQENRPVRIFMTGGMSYNPDIFEAVKATVPAGSTFQRIPALESIVAGLALAARQLSLASSTVLEPKLVRGVPILS